MTMRNVSRGRKEERRRGQKWKETKKKKRKGMKGEKDPVILRKKSAKNGGSRKLDMSQRGEKSKESREVKEYQAGTV